jgi:hypothetical protein
MEMKQEMMVVLGVLLVSLWIWPNIVHEPLHLAALALQGSGGTITWDWGFPPHPFIVREPIQTVAGGLFFLLLPSVVSVIVLAIFALMKPRAAIVGLGTYLAFDLTINVLGWRAPISDFHWLVAIDGGRFWAIGVAGIAILTGTYLFMRLLDVHKVQRNGGDSNTWSTGNGDRGSARRDRTALPTGSKPLVRSNS